MGVVTARNIVIALLCIAVCACVRQTSEAETIVKAEVKAEVKADEFFHATVIEQSPLIEDGIETGIHVVAKLEFKKAFPFYWPSPLRFPYFDLEMPGDNSQSRNNTCKQEIVGSATFTFRDDSLRPYVEYQVVDAGEYQATFICRWPGISGREILFEEGDIHPHQNKIHSRACVHGSKNKLSIKLITDSPGIIKNFGLRARAIHYNIIEQGSGNKTTKTNHARVILSVPIVNNTSVTYQTLLSEGSLPDCQALENEEINAQRATQEKLQNRKREKALRLLSENSPLNRSAVDPEKRVLRETIKKMIFSLHDVSAGSSDVDPAITALLDGDKTKLDRILLYRSRAWNRSEETAKFRAVSTADFNAETEGQVIELIMLFEAAKQTRSEESESFWRIISEIGNRPITRLIGFDNPLYCGLVAEIKDKPQLAWRASVLKELRFALECAGAK